MIFYDIFSKCTFSVRAECLFLHCFLKVYVFCTISMPFQFTLFSQNVAVLHAATSNMAVELQWYIVT